MGSPVVLGIESSCDETGAGLVRDGRLLGHALASSMDEHARFGGVVPEIAARAHVHSFGPVVRQALDSAGLRMSDIGAVAVTTGPGLSGALQVGLAGAKGWHTRWTYRCTGSITWRGTSPWTPWSTARCPSLAWC